MYFSITKYRDISLHNCIIFWTLKPLYRYERFSKIKNLID